MLLSVCLPLGVSAVLDQSCWFRCWCWTQLSRSISETGWKARSLGNSLRCSRGWAARAVYIGLGKTQHVIRAFHDRQADHTWYPNPKPKEAPWNTQTLRPDVFAVQYVNIAGRWQNVEKKVTVVFISGPCCPVNLDLPEVRIGRN